MMCSRQPTFDALRRLLAAGSAALVFALGLMAVSPALHEWAHAATCEHGHDHSAPTKDDQQPYGDDHSCAVATFAHGLTVAVGVIAPDRTPATPHLEAFPAAAGLLLSRATSLLPPGRAPPLV
ncbi:MAG: hypothetical protein IT582_09505 [Opitutaceae bacterium]|nr:hypothetical protein [Opitutaceae bacterium]